MRPANIASQRMNVGSLWVNYYTHIWVFLHVSRLPLATTSHLSDL